MQLHVEIATWTHNTHGLFDYESKELKVTKYTLRNTKHILLNNDVVDLSDDQQIESCIGTFSFEANNIVFVSTQDAYVKLDPKQKQQLYVGDLYKFGRMEYFLSEMSDGEQVQLAKNTYNLDRHIKTQKSKEPRQCKFCLMDDTDQTEEPDNPFLSQLCNCQGHLSWVHYICLKQWVNLNSRITCKQTENTVQYHWSKALLCDVCKDPLPARVYLENKPEPLQMIQVEKIGGSYLIFEQITRQENLAKSLILIHSFGTQQISIGRGHTSEVRCQDISVSRNHTIISFSNQAWFIQDQGSKFGTLRIIQKRLPLSKEIQEIQIGRVHLKVRII